MGKHGTSGTSWPTALDTACTEVDFGTLARAAVPNEISQAVVAMQGYLANQFVDTQRFTTFADAEQYAYTNNMTLLVTSSQNITVVGQTIRTGIMFTQGGRLVKSGGTLPNITGAIVGNPMHQIFSGFAAGEVTGLKEINPRWFGGLNNTITVLSTSTAHIILDYNDTLTASLTIPLTCSIEFYRTGSITKGSASSLTIAGPIVGNPMHQIFSGFAAGEVTFGVGSIKTFHPIWVNYDLALSISFAPAGCELDLGNYSSYSIDGTWNINKAISVLGYYSTVTFPTADNTSRGVKITASNVAMRGLTVVGGGYADAHYNRVGILAQGTNDATRLTNIILEDCKVSNCVQGVRLEYVNNFYVNNNKVLNTYNCGIGVQTGAYGKIINNDVDNVTTGQCYGIIVTHTTVETDTVSTDIMISHNSIRNVPTWHGIDTHGGANLTITDNNIYNTLRGIHVGVLQRSSTVFVAPVNIVIEDNAIYNDYNATKGQAARYIGIQIAGGRGAAPTYTPYSIKSLVCNNNSISGFQYGINMEYITRSIISGNNIKDFYHGIGIGASVQKVLISNNNVDIWDTQSASDCRGINFTTVSIWEANTAYNLNDIVVKIGASNSYSYICTQAGTSGGTEPGWTTTTTNDNTVIWTTIPVSGVSTGTISNNKIEMSSSSFSYAGIKCEEASKVRTITEMNIINNDIICGGNKYHDPLTFLGNIDITKGYTSVASATSLILGQSGDVIFVTGTTTVTSIAASSSIAGRTVKLIFEGALTFTNGSNLKLAGNFPTAANYTITLSCNGTNWFEDCRSVNP